MIRKLLFITFSLISTVAFSQKSIQKLSAFPNPFTNQTKITFVSDNQQTVVLIVKDVLGKTVYRKPHKVRPGKNSIPFSKNNLRTGMYIYAIQNSKELVSKRFVIK